MTVAPLGGDSQVMPLTFDDLGSSLKQYKLFVEEYDLMLAPSVVKLLDKLDSIKDSEKRKAPAEEVVKALDTWVKTQKLSKEATDAFAKLKVAVQADPNKKGPPPAPPMPYKRPPFLPDYQKGRDEAFGGIAAALGALDKSKTLADAKPQAEILLKLVEDELAGGDAYLKAIKDTNRKAPISKHLFDLRKMRDVLKELAK